MAFQAEPSRVHPRRRPLLTSPPSLSAPEGHFRIKKGETFHSPTSPPSEDRDPVMAVRSMPRRSPTCPKSLEAVAAGEQRMADILGGLDLNSIGLSSSSSASWSQPDNDLPVPRGFLGTKANAGFDPTAVPESSSKRPMMDSSRPNSPPAKRRQHEHLSDSGLGTSISDNQGISSDKGKVRAGQLSVHGLEPGLHTQATQTQATQSAITSSISAFESNPFEAHQLPFMACQQIERLILEPLLRLEQLKPFHPLLQSIPQRIVNKEIVCLRDLEKTLLWLAPHFTTSQDLYFSFCEFTIQYLHRATYHLNDREQRHPADRPYTNGYFLDLGQQIRQHAAMIIASRNNVQSKGKAPMRPGMRGASMYDNEFASSTQNWPQSDYLYVSPENLTMEGSSKDVLPAREPSASELKRNLSVGSVDESAVRSMARRKKNAPPMDINKKCAHCDKVFKRPCDLTKHEKTHVRPWKCEEKSCKYFQIGWPTEKERDRHMNDKHSKDPSLYRCRYTGCTYRSKRESNCKQHMEKTHGWAYVRSKNNGRGARRPSAQPSVRGSVQPFFQQTPQSSSMATPPSGSASLSTPLTDPSPSPYLDVGLDWNGLGTQGFDHGLSGNIGGGLQGLDSGFATDLDVQNFGNAFNNSNLDLQNFGNGFDFNFSSFDHQFTPNLDLQAFDNELISLNPPPLPTAPSSAETGAMHSYSCDPLISAPLYPSFGYY